MKTGFHSSREYSEGSITSRIKTRCPDTAIASSQLREFPIAAHRLLWLFPLPPGTPLLVQTPDRDSSPMTRVIAMTSRFFTVAAGAAALLAAISSDALAQRSANYDATVSGNDPVARLFGMSGSPIARETVSYPGNHRPGTIVISTRERRLYLVLGNGQALRYGIGVGRIGFTWSGVTRISAKREWAP